MKEVFEKIKERLEEEIDNAKVLWNEDDFFLGKANAYTDALSIVSEVEAEYINKSTEHINKSSDCSTKWIPCSERLPKECVPVLVCNEDGKVYIRQINWISRGRAEIPYWSQNSTGIIAWMPLPLPYEPRKGD